MFWWVLLLICYTVYRLHAPPPNEKAIFGIYRQPNIRYPFKLVLLYIMMLSRQIWRWYKVNDESENEDDIKLHKDIKKGVHEKKSRVLERQEENIQPLSHHPKAIDAVYFNGASRDGYALIGAVARRPHGVVNGFLFLRIPGIGLLVLPRQPDTLLFQSPQKDCYSAEGLEFKMFQPMVAWTVKYYGKMRVERGENDYVVGSLVNVELDGFWSTDFLPFDFDTDMAPISVARALAREPWTRDYFKVLKDLHQTHYEQCGEFTGRLSVNHRPSLPMKLDMFRDHSFGFRREWKNFHRYVLHMITMESGERIGVHIISQPVVFSSLETGYMYFEDKSLAPVDNCSFKLYEHGENGTIPQDYGFSFTSNNKTYQVKVLVMESTELYIGWEWEAKVVECFCRFEVNGRKGWGATEFHYRNLRGRPLSVTQTDPKWTHDIIKG